MFFILFYDYVDDILEKRTPHREAHLALIREYAERGVILLAGAYQEPTDGAAFIFKADDSAEVEAFAACDPYQCAGLVTNWSIRQWAVAAGALA